MYSLLNSNQQQAVRNGGVFLAHQSWRFVKHISRYSYRTIKTKAPVIWKQFKRLSWHLWDSVKKVSQGVTHAAGKPSNPVIKLHHFQHRRNNPNWHYQAHYQALKALNLVSGHLSSFSRQLYQKKGQIGLILGARGTGKTALALRIAENLVARHATPVYALGFASEALPKWIQPISSLSEVKKKSRALVLIDEAGINFQARRAQSADNLQISELMLIARHKDLNLLFVTQNSANVDINVVRQADLLFFKPLGLMQTRFERKAMAHIMEQAEVQLQPFADDKGATYVVSGDYEAVFSNALPGFWSNTVSKAYAAR